MMASFGLLALALTAVPVQDSTDFERFQLFNDCEPVSLVVRLNITKGETDLNLTKERLQFAAESRLRGARLFKADTGLPFLHVGHDVVGQAFAVSVGYNKVLFDPASGSRGFAPAWRATMGGTYGQSAEVIFVSEHRKNVLAVPVASLPVADCTDKRWK